MITEFVMGVGSFLCHQMPERSISINGLQLFVCSRCMGIYLGFFLAFLISLYSKEYLREHFQVRWMFLLFAPILLDGGLQLAGLHESTNVLRLFTGLFAGVAMAWLTAMILGKTLTSFRGAKEEEGAFPSRGTGIVSVTAAFVAFLLMIPLTNNTLLTGGILIYWILTGVCLLSIATIQIIVLIALFEILFRPNYTLEEKIREIEAK